ncbi:MAG: MazG nucleotide pyrophosphohydrolase domain-containing protein [Elusimicrobiota bacterium]
MKINKKKKEHYTFKELVEIMLYLRSEKGCPWDKKQTHLSLIKYLREETEETIENIENNLLEHDLKEELGDILLQILFHSQIADEEKRFNIYDVIDTLARKLIRRHPHVFAGKKIKTLKELNKAWQEIKDKEKKRPKKISIV